MAKAVTLKNNNNEEIYPVTDLSLVNGNIPTGRIADNAITTPKIADGTITTDKIADGAVTTGKIADKAITSDKIDWKTLGYKHASAPTDVTVEASNTTLVTLKLTAGTWLLIGTSDFTHKNTAIGDSYIGFQNLTVGTGIGDRFYFNKTNDGTNFFIETVHGVVTLTKDTNIGFIVRKGKGTLIAKRRSFTAIRIG